MSSYKNVGSLQVHDELYNFINGEALPGSGLNPETFWREWEELIKELTPINKSLLQKRDEIQRAINEWHRNNGHTYDLEAYKEFLTKLGYLEPDPEDFVISTEGVDPEIALQAGPQLVVPVNNARYSINAANARWGSLYDALYGTDVITEEDGCERGSSYNPIRGQKVIDYGRDFLDRTVPLESGSHKQVASYKVENEKLLVLLNDGKEVGLSEPHKFAGFNGDSEEPASLLFKNHNLHFEIQIDRSDRIGGVDGAGVKDIVLEAAITTIMDCEDSVTAVDAEDKVVVYRNWLGLMRGNLEAAFSKGGKSLTRKLSADRSYLSPNGESFTLKGRSLMFVRNVGHLMTNNAILDAEGNEIQEGIMDTVITSLLAKHSLVGNTTYQNSTQDSIYIVKPKMHGSEEVAFANTLFNRVEDLLRLKRNTIKIGVMDEERRTSLNLKACIREVRERVVFINTGFLDRTGDEIHTSMDAGPMIRKDEMKLSQWLQAYEKSNVTAGLKSGFQGRAQIGKGMWAMPDNMKEMMEKKIDHLKTGANTAWVPSPTAAVLHALHYHEVEVEEVQKEKLNGLKDLRNEILEIPVDKNQHWTAEEIQRELDNNAQGILGYVVRWVEQGIGCSKVPDIHNVGLMEDRATLRISSQHMANWLHHGICSQEQVLETLKRMAKVVDNQNAGDPAYRPMSENEEESVAFQAACDLIFLGYEQPSGYTEPILHRRRMEAKAKYSFNHVQG